MPVDIPLLLKIAESVRDFLDALDQSKLSKKERLKTALLMVMTAANETRFYLAGMKAKKESKPDVEARLSTLWTKAAVELMEFDKDLAEICRLSGEFWSDAREWRYHEINNLKRVLRVVSERVERLMEK
jgi:hypothetical protein